MKDYVTIEETNWIEEFETLFSKLEEADAPNVLEEVKQFISKLISQEREKWNEDIYFTATNIARMTHQIVGEKNDLYITLQQLEGMMSDL